MSVTSVSERSDQTGSSQSATSNALVLRPKTEVRTTSPSQETQMTLYTRPDLNESDPSQSDSEGSVTDTRTAQSGFDGTLDSKVIQPKVLMTLESYTQGPETHPEGFYYATNNFTEDGSMQSMVAKTDQDGEWIRAQDTKTARKMFESHRDRFHSMMSGMWGFPLLGAHFNRTPFYDLSGFGNPLGLYNHTKDTATTATGGNEHTRGLFQPTTHFGPGFLENLLASHVATMAPFSMMLNSMLPPMFTSPLAHTFLGGGTGARSFFDDPFLNLRPFGDAFDGPFGTLQGARPPALLNEPIDNTIAETTIDNTKLLESAPSATAAG